MSETMSTSPNAQSWMGALARIINVLITPKAAFEDIAQRPTWLAPLVLISLVSIAVIAIYSQRVGWRAYMEKQFADNPRTAQMTADQREEALDRGVRWAQAIGYISSVVGTLAAAAIVASVLLGAFNLLASAQLNFKTVFGIVSHAWMPYVVGGVLGIGMLYIEPAENNVDIENLVPLHLGAFLSNDSARWLRTLASSFNLFSLWAILLMAVGLAAARPKKVRFGTALRIVGGLWLGYVLVKTGWVAVFS